MAKGAIAASTRTARTTYAAPMPATRLATAVPMTMPRVWVMPMTPLTRPRCSRGTRSGTAAVRPARVPLSPACTTHQPRTMAGTEGASARTTSPSAPTSAPPTIQGTRRPRRERVRSLRAPATGLARVETAAPMPVTRVRVASLWSGVSAAACRPSSTWMGPNHPQKSPVPAIPRRVIQPRLTGAAGPAPASGPSAVTVEGGSMTHRLLTGSPGWGRVGSAEHDPRDRRAHQVRQRGRSDGAQPERGDVAATVRRQATEPAEQDAQRADVGEAGQGEGDDRLRPRGEGLHHGAEVAE